MMNSTSTYRVTTVLSPPFVMNKPGGGYEGYIVDLMDRVSEMVRFKYQLSLAKDGRYGGRDANSGVWSGMIGELVRREADIAAADLTITADRERVVDFTKPFLSQGVRLLVKKPSRAEPSLGFLLEPFSSEVWFCILVALVIVAILFMLIGRFNPYEWRQVPSDKDPRGARHSFGLRESLMFVFSTATLQGYRETPRSLSGRVLTISWFIFIFLIIVAYIGVAVAFIISGADGKMPTLPFDNIDDLVQQSEIKVGIVNGNTYTKVKESKIDVYQRLAERISTDPQQLLTNTDEGVKRVRKLRGQFVMLIESLRGEYEASRVPCDLMLHGPNIFSSGLGLATPIRSDIRDALNLAILELRENGVLHNLQRKWWTEKGMCQRKRSYSKMVLPASALTLRNMAAPFLILLIGAILSIISLVGEVVFKKRRN